MIHIEQTPNPNSIRFLSEKTISSIGTEEFQRKDINKIDNEFVKNLLKIKGVELVLLADKFLSVKKDNKISWDSIKPTVVSHINDYFQNHNEPILNKKQYSKNENSDSDELVKRIKQVLDSKVRPAVAKDGGDIKFKSFKDGVVFVELQGSCSGCPSSLMTLKQGVQNLLCHYIEEVKSVEAL